MRVLLVIPTVLEIFYQEFVRKALLLVTPTTLEIFYQEFVRKALLLVIPAVVEIFDKICPHHTKALILGNPRVIFEPHVPAERLSIVSSPYMACLLVFKKWRVLT